MKFAFVSGLFMLLAMPFVTTYAAEPLKSSDLPRQWIFVPDSVAPMPDSDAWWKEFNDPLLDSLITEAIAGNYNLDVSARRMQMARQAVNTARAAWWPTVGVNAGWSASRAGGTGHNMWNAGAQMSWEIDLFGTNYMNVKSKQALEQASRADYCGAMVSLCAQLASAYIDLRMYQVELAVQEEHLSNQAEVLRIVKVRHESNLVSGLDVAQSQTVYNTTLAGIAPLRESVNQSITAIALLLGRLPSDIAGRLDRDAGLPPSTPGVTSYMPAGLLRRRPDVVSAERTVASYAAALGIAKRDFLPTLTLQGSITSTAHKPGDMFRDASMTYTIAPTLSWTLFDGMARRAAAVSAREQLQAGIDSYNQTLLQAVTEVENAMTACTNSRQYVEDVRNAMTAAADAMQKSIDQYKTGLTNYTSVANAQISFLQEANTLVQARAQADQAVIDLYRALGGGWSGL